MYYYNRMVLIYDICLAYQFFHRILTSYTYVSCLWEMWMFNITQINNYTWLIDFKTFFCYFLNILACIIIKIIIFNDEESPIMQKCVSKGYKKESRILGNTSACGNILEKYTHALLRIWYFSAINQPIPERIFDLYELTMLHINLVVMPRKQRNLVY